MASVDQHRLIRCVSGGDPTRLRWRRRSWCDSEDLCRQCGGRHWPLLSPIVYWGNPQDHYWPAERGAHLYFACRAKQSQHADLHAPINSAVPWLLQEARKPALCCRAVLRMVKLRSRSCDNQNDSGCRKRINGSCVDVGRNAHRNMSLWRHRSQYPRMTPMTP